MNFSPSGNCRICNKLAVAKYRENNKGKISILFANWREKNIEKVKIKRSKYYLENLDKEKCDAKAWRIENPLRVKEAEKKWRTNHMEAKRLIQHNRNARIKSNGGILSKGLTEKLLKLQKGKCACCGNLLGDDYHLDHRMPIFLGGLNEDSNIQLLRAICNQQKGAKHPINFMQSKGFLL